jgi:hypothetical protein
MEVVDSTPATNFFAGSSAAPLLEALRTRNAEATCLACPKVLEITVLRKGIVERFVYNVVCGGVDESGVLIDLLGGGLIEPNRSTDVAGLVDFKQGHCCSP